MCLALKTPIAVQGMVNLTVLRLGRPIVAATNSAFGPFEERGAR
jgi:hypothetical protein